MRAEKVIYALLVADAGVTSLAGTAPVRVYPSHLPQNTVMPAITVQVVSGMESPVIDAQAGQSLVMSRIQVTVMGKDYKQLKDLVEAVRLACLYKSGLIAGVRVLAILRDGVGPDLRDDDLDLYLQSIDFMVRHYET
jgi:hypothetical protein